MKQQKPILKDEAGNLFLVKQKVPLQEKLTNF